jgi:hypothetical protein
MALEWRKRAGLLRDPGFGGKLVQGKAKLRRKILRTSEL